MQTVALFSCLFISIFSQTLFLQKFQSNQKTSLGTIGQGLEQIDSDLSSFSSSLSDSFKTIDDQIDISISLTTTLATSLLSSQISELERELSTVEDDIEELEANLETIQTCSEYSTCSGCSYDYNCV